MTGRETSGPGAADPDLFREAIYCVCPAPGAREQSVALIEAAIKPIGAKC